MWPHSTISWTRTVRLQRFLAHLLLIPLSHLCGSSRGSLRFCNRREPQETANIPPDEPRVSVTFRACSRKNLNMFDFSARILRKRRKAVKRKETAKTVREAYWPQVKRKPSATFRKTTAAFRLSYTVQTVPFSATTFWPIIFSVFSYSVFLYQQVQLLFAFSFWQWP